MSTVLLLGSGTQSLAIIPLLHGLKHRVVILCDHHSNYGDRSRYVDKVIRIPSVDEKSYLYSVLRIITVEKIDVIIPMGDSSAEFLSKYKPNFAEQHIVTPDYSSFCSGYNKNLLMALCKGKGYPHPQTIDLSKVDYRSDELKSFPFPAMLKPNCTTGGRGMVEVKNYDEFVAVFPD